MLHPNPQASALGRLQNLEALHPSPETQTFRRVHKALSGITDVALQWVTQTDSDMFGTLARSRTGNSGP